MDTQSSPQLPDISSINSTEISSPFFGIAITNYNHGEYLEQALRSVLSQSFGDWEIGIIDDGSTDNSWEIIQRVLADFPENKIFFCHRNETRQGVCRNRNNILERSSASYFLYLDADDYFLPGFFESLSSELRDNDYPDFVQFLEEKLDCQTGKRWVEKIAFWADSLDKLIIPRSINFNYVYSREAFSHLRGFDTEFFEDGWEDWEFVLRAGQKYGCFFSRLIGLVYRVNKSSRGVAVRELPKDRYFRMVRVLFQRNPILCVFGYREYAASSGRKQVLHVYPEDLDLVPEKIWETCRVGHTGFRKRSFLVRYQRV